MSIVTLQSVKKDFGIKEILRDADLSIDARDKVGLIGTNGSGKSTLLKIIAGLEYFDEGDRFVNSQKQLIYLPQQPELDENRTVLEQVFADSGDRMALVRRYEELSHRMAHVEGDELEPLMAKLGRVTEQMAATGAWELETQAKIILSKLGIADFDAKIANLSGGYRKRIALATALLAEPDLLLMDEPTNHLDAESVEWLQDYLGRYRGAILLVTHDRYFLDRVTNRILEIDRGDLYNWGGNYSYYLEKKALSEEASASSQRKHRGVLRRELEWLKKGPKARSTKQKARIQRIQDMEATEFKSSLGRVDIATPGRRIGKKVIEVENLSKTYEDVPLIQDFTYEFNREDRVGIIGANGTGKSTLVNLISGRIEPDAGGVEIGSTIHIGYFDQHSEDLMNAGDRNQRAIDYIKDVAELVTTADGSVITASQMLERFLFPPAQQYSPIYKLSGGEKRRLFLLRVLMSAPNVLILDEPTNDLDVQTLSVLEEYLDDFNGCVIIVSHDRYFLDRTVYKIFAIEPEGYIRQYPGNYSIYLEYKQAEEAAAKEAETAKPTPAKERGRTPGNNAKPRRLSFKERQEFEVLELKIPELETQKAEIEATLYESPPDGYTQVRELSERLAQLDRQIDEATERWLALADVDANS